MFVEVRRVGERDSCFASSNGPHACERASMMCVPVSDMPASLSVFVWMHVCVFVQIRGALEGGFHVSAGHR